MQEITDCETQYQISNAQIVKFPVDVCKHNFTHTIPTANITYQLHKLCVGIYRISKNYTFNRNIVLIKID